MKSEIYIRIEKEVRDFMRTFLDGEDPGDDEIIRFAWKHCWRFVPTDILECLGLLTEEPMLLMQKFDLLINTTGFEIVRRVVAEWVQRTMIDEYHWIVVGIRYNKENSNV